jgi:hypothetical protein
VGQNAATLWSSFFFSRLLKNSQSTTKLKHPSYLRVLVNQANGKVGLFTSFMQKYLLPDYKLDDIVV